MNKDTRGVPQGVLPGAEELKWKAVIVAPTGAAVNTPAFGLRYSFPTKEEADSQLGQAS
jgi:hypothetical protein